MKKLIALLLLFMLSYGAFSQQIAFHGRVIDGINFMPIDGANIYNSSTKKFVFSDKDGYFTINCKKNDTIILSRSIYRQVIVVMDDILINKKQEDFFLYYKAVLLREVSVISLNPTYEGFKRDLAKIEIPEIYKTISGTEITEQDKANAEYNKGPNVFRNTPIAHPISFLYETFSRKCKMKRLYNEMVQYEDRLDEVPLKYNKQIVKDITNLPDDEILNFMMYCHFSYYDLVRWSPTQVINAIQDKYINYEYQKIKKN
ncbi:MAG: carboxypeptidase-like regulatory domain-containing protein [Bacteroidales bacterium]|nr:carboxypeptidase-like regulatory domain-containing protein [Bacteroidales bacterium]